jgi:TonB family protein
MRSASLAILSLLSLFTYVSAQQLPDGKALLEGEIKALQSYVSYQYTEETTTQVTAMGTPMSVPMTTQVQAVNPNRIRMEMKTGNQVSSLMISDGDSTWMYIPMLKQYSKLSRSDADVERIAAAMTAADMVPASDNATTKGSESVEVDGTPHDCWVVEGRAAKQPLGGMEIQDAVYTSWIDKQTGITLKRTMSGKMQGGPLPNAMEMRTTSVKHSLKFDEALPYSLFTFVPPADAKETDLLAGLDADAPGFGLAPGAKAAPKSPQTLQPPAPQPKSQASEPQAYIPFLNPLNREEAEWPEAAKAQAVHGMVRVLITVDPQGSVANAEALTGPQILRKPAVAAVSRWTFRPVMRGGHAVFAYTQATVNFLDYSKPVTPDSFGFDVGEEMAALQRIQELQSRWPRSPTLVLADLEQDLGGRDNENRGYALPQLAKAAVAAGALDKASLYASELLTSAQAGDWNDGNAIHDGNMVRGLVALRSGNVEQAAKDLIEAGKTTGSPQLNSFGPNMTLASELLEKGQRDAVLEYLTLCKKFWTLGSTQLDTRIDAIRTGGKPDFGANLLY